MTDEAAAVNDTARQRQRHRRPVVRFATTEDPLATPTALTHLINTVYTPAEAGLVRSAGATSTTRTSSSKEEEDPTVPRLVQRMTVARAAQHVHAQEFLILEGLSVVDHDDTRTTTTAHTKASTTSRGGQHVLTRQLLGCCLVSRVNEEVGEWACLAVDSSAQGQGYGRRLLQAAHAYLTDYCGCRTLQLHFLAPRDETLLSPHKQRLLEWYVGRQDYEAVPEEAVHFAADAPFGDFVGVYFATDAVLVPYWKRVPTWIALATHHDVKYLPELVDMVNTVYSQGEAGILKATEDHPLHRLSLEEARQLIAKHELLILWGKYPADHLPLHQSQPPHPHHQRSVLGCIQIHTEKGRNGSTTGEWGCLAVRPASQGRGYASRLVRAAQAHLVSVHSCTHWKLVLLTPVYWQHPHKERLRAWYESMGYVKSNDAVEGKKLGSKAAGDKLGPLVFATDAVFTEYVKSVPADYVW
jgi:ribosomal protein S18 acetylase RimI-like enzyme